MTTVTFTKLTAEENLEIAAKAGLDGLEWADKYHVISGNVQQAREVRKMTADAGLEVLSYGSFFTQADHDIKYFEETLACAVELETKIIRIWSGNVSAENATEEDRKHFNDLYREAAKLAEPYGITIATEFHPRSLTESAASTLRLIDEVGMDNFRTYWQPMTGDIGLEANLRDLKAVLPYVTNVHVFAWNGGRRLLSEQSAEWAEYLKLLDGVDRSLLIEFVHDGTAETLYEDAKTLREWVK